MCLLHRHGYLRRRRALTLVTTLMWACACQEATSFLKSVDLPEPAAPIARGARSPVPQPLPLRQAAPKPPRDTKKSDTKKSDTSAGKVVAKKGPSAETLDKQRQKRQREEARKRAQRVVPLDSLTLPTGSTHGNAPQTDYPLLAVFARIRQIASVGEVRMILPWLTKAVQARLRSTHHAEVTLPMAPRTLWHRLSGKLVSLRYEGQRALLTLDGPYGEHVLTFFVEDRGWRLDLPDDLVRQTNKKPEPLIKLKEATAGLAGRGPLTAVFQTSGGTFRCELLEGQAPNTVAHFVGLVRGMLGPLGRKAGQRPFYDGTRLHRGAPDKFIQGGDPSELGTGGAGFTVSDEFHPALNHNKPGTLSLARAGPHTGSSQFFVTVVAAPALNGRHTVFGRCRDLEVLRAISRRAPRTVTLKRVTVGRSL